MTFDLALAKDIVRNAELPPAPAKLASLDGDQAALVFKEAQEQAFVVGSEVLAFSDAVGSKVREAISNSALLAQLVTTQKLGKSKDPIAWFESYLSLLTQLGWVLQSRTEASNDFKGSGLEVHEALIKVLEEFLVEGPALALAKSALDGLKSLKKDSPLIKIFNKESQSGEVGRFQITTVSHDPEKGVLVELMAFSLDAHAKLTQIIFFKFTGSKARMRGKKAALSINETALDQMKQDIADRIKAYQSRFIADLPLPALD